MILVEREDYVRYVVFSNKEMFDYAVKEIAFQMFNMDYDPNYIDEDDVEKILIDISNGEFELDSVNTTNLIRDDMKLYYNSESDEKDEEIYAPGNYVVFCDDMCEYIISKIRKYRKVNGFDDEDFKD